MLATKYDWLVNIRQRIPELHPGQVIILVLIAASALALLLPVRRDAAATKRSAEHLLSEIRPQLDSLNYLLGYPRDSVENPHRNPFLNLKWRDRPALSPSESARAENRSMDLYLLQAKQQAERDGSAVQLFGLDKSTPIQPKAASTADKYM